MKPAYYNENDPKAAAWLRELIKRDLIAPGEVDERSICDVQGSDLEGFTQCHFFAGIGGWSLALRLAGWGDDRPVWSGSCPCQPFSVAGKGKGHADERHLWPEFMRLIAECRPDVVVGEQVEAAIRHGWVDGVQADLEREGYACGYAVLGAHSVGAPHIRQRVFWVADAQQRPAERQRYDMSAAESRAQGQARQQRVWDDAGAGFATGGLADAQHQRTRPGVEGIEGQSRKRRGGLADGGETGGLPDAASGGQRINGRSSGDGGYVDELRAADRLVQPVGAGLEGLAGHGDDGDQPRRLGAEQDGSTTPAGGWDDYVVIPFADGKSRRIEPRTGALVARLPGGVVRGGDRGEQDFYNSAEARAMRLRGYGNSIVPAVAAAFIETVMECL